MSEGACRKGGAGKGGKEDEEREEGWLGGWEGRSARCCRGVGRERGEWEEARRKRRTKETNQIMKKNKLIMLDVTGYNDVN